MRGLRIEGSRLSRFAHLLIEVGIKNHIVRGVGIRVRKGENASVTEYQVRKASGQFYDVLNRMSEGDMDPMSEICGVTICNPFGGRQTGWQDARLQFARIAGISVPVVRRVVWIAQSVLQNENA